MLAHMSCAPQQKSCAERSCIPWLGNRLRPARSPTQTIAPTTPPLLQAAKQPGYVPGKLRPEARFVPCLLDEFLEILDQVGGPALSHLSPAPVLLLRCCRGCAAWHNPPLHDASASLRVILRRATAWPLHMLSTRAPIPLQAGGGGSAGCCINRGTTPTHPIPGPLALFAQHAHTYTQVPAQTPQPQTLPPQTRS